MVDTMKSNGFESFIENYTYDFHVKKNELTPAIRSKNHSFHYLPYNFWQSKFELEFLKESLNLKEIQEKNLEVYYNGEKHLTDFRIICYAKKNNHYQKIGFYTPDFLIIKRQQEAINKVLIIETKGSGFAEQSQFEDRQKFMKTEFLQINNKEFGYQKFEYLCLQDNLTIHENLAKLNNIIVEFFK